MNTASNKLSLILMRDDGEARSIRISKKGLWLLIILTITSPLTGLMGIWVGWEAWQSISSWQQEKLAYQIQLDELRVQLERFATLEALLKRQDAALSSKTNLQQNSSSSLNRNITEKGVQSQEGAIKQEIVQPKVSDSSPIAVSSNTISSQKSKDIPSMNKDSTYFNNTVKSDIQGNRLLNINSTSETADKKDIGSSQVTSNISFIDHGIVKVENVQVKFLEAKRIQVQLGLFSTEKFLQISGYVQLSLITETGEKHILSGSETSFRISRFKRILINSPLPVAKILDKTQLLVEVISEDNVIYRQLYPLIDN